MNVISMKLKLTLHELGISLMIGLIVGLLMSLVANAFVFGVAYFSGLRTDLILFPISIGGNDYSLTPLFVLPDAALLVVFVRKRLNIARFHGPADSIYAAHRTDNELDVKTGLGSTFIAFISASGGASVGQYGPLVHFGATMGSFFKRWFGARATTDIFIGCGVAGAISAGFNAPLAGVIFALEAILRHFSLRAVAPIAISSISASAFSHWLFGSNHAFRVEITNIDLLGLLPPVIMSGPIFGLIAVMFMFSMRYAARLATTSKLSPLPLALIAAIGCAGVGVFVPEVLGLGTSVVQSIVSGGSVPVDLSLLLVLKLFVTALCIGFGLFGGVFSPAIFLGAVSGAVLATLFSGYDVGNLSTILIVCGMAAVAAPVLGAPLAAVLIILELTLSYETAVIALITVVLSGIVANVLYGTSFFDRQLLDRGIDILRGRGHLKMMETPITDLAQNDFVQTSPTTRVKTGLELLIKHNSSEIYIVDRNGKFAGKTTIVDMLRADPAAHMSALADLEQLSIKSDASLLQAIEVASTFVGESIPIIDREENVLLGVVTESDLFTAYLDLQNNLIDIEKK